MARVSTELRDLIVEMRKSPGGTYRAIASELGVSVGKVQRELAKAAREVVERGPGAAGPVAPIAWPTNPAPPELAGGALSGMLDPEIRERRRALEFRKLQLEETRLEATELEMKNRVAVMRGGQQGGDSAVLAYVLSELTRVRESAAGSGPAKPATMLDTLSEFRQVGEIVKSFAPPNPASREDLELQIAVQRINAESQRILREREDEFSIRRRQIEGQAARDDAVAKMIEQFGPVLGAYLSKQIENADRQAAPPSTPTTGSPSLPAASASSPPAAAGRGHCPRCQYPPGAQEMELTPTGNDACPGCGAGLTVRDGAIVLAEGAPPAAAAPAATTSPNGHNAATSAPSGPQTFTF